MITGVEKYGYRNDSQILLVRFLTFFEELMPFSYDVPSKSDAIVYGRAFHFLRPNPNGIFEFLHLHSFTVLTEYTVIQCTLVTV